MAEPARILIRATNWVGDAVMSLPAVRAIRARYPEAHIAVLARPWVADLYATESSVDAIIRYTPRSGFRDFGAKWRAARDLRTHRFDCAILLQNAFEAALVARMAGIATVIGYNRDGRGWLLTSAIPVPRPGEIPLHERFYYLELLRRAGIVAAMPESGVIRLDGIEAAAEKGRHDLAARGFDGPVIGVSPGAAFGTAKRWLPERFASSAATLAARHHASICLFGSASERELCEEVKRHICDELRCERVLNLAGETSLRGFIEAAAACCLFLTNDSGAMHLASALGVPTVTIFGATNPLTTGPTGALARVVRVPVPCSPCLLRECPIDHRCMTNVATERVVAEAEELLARQPA